MGNLHIQLHVIDYLIMIVYFVFVLGIGWMLKRRMKNSSDFLMAGKAIPAWVAGLAFLSANLGAQEVMGMAASGAKYGMMTSHFYWIGAIPAMAFIAIFMMPFYYGSKARSVPEYLKLRYDEKTRALNSISFSVMTIFSSGISMHALAMLLQMLLGWNYNFSIFISGLIVLAYIFMGGLGSAIYNEVIQFFLIVLGFSPLLILGLIDIGGWDALVAKLNVVALENGFASGAWTESWHFMGTPSQNPMGIEWFGMIMGLGFVLSFGYWCTDFLVVQRAMAADSMEAARKTPLLAAFPKMFFPFLVIVPGMIAIALQQRSGGTFLPISANGTPEYNMAIPAMLAHYFPEGLLGLGLTALMASFMSGMAGNVTAFNAVWTYDIYQSYICKNKSDKHYFIVGQFATFAGIALSMGAAYMARSFNNIMDMLQFVFAFVNAPLFATFMLGMFWKRTTGHGAFAGLISGTCAAALHHGLTLPAHCLPGIKGAWLGIVIHNYPSEMAQSFWTAIIAWTCCFTVTIIVSLLTSRRKTDEDLKGLVYALTPKQDDSGMPWYRRPVTLALCVLVLALILNLIFM